MIKKEGVILVLVFFILCCSFSSASVIPGNPFFNLSQGSFGPGQVLEGYFNFSLENEPGNIMVSGQVAAEMKEMNLLDFLQEGEVDFNCDPSDCDVTYQASIPSQTKTVVLSEEEKYFGLVAFGTNPQILNLSFYLTGQSTANPICGESPLKIDLLDDGIIDYEYKEPSGEWCSDLRHSRCYDPSIATGVSVLTSTPLCQKISLNKTGRLEVAAELKVYSGEPWDYDIEFTVYDLGGSLIGNCSVDYFYELEYSFAKCFIGPEFLGEESTFFIEEAGDYLLCIRNKGTSSAEYWIKKETQEEVCGFYGEPPSQTYNEDYSIYVHEAKFNAFTEEVVFDESMHLGDVPLMTYVQNYINSEYGGNCTGFSGCIIPIKFISSASQTLTLSDINFKYHPQGTSPTYNNYFYDLIVEWPKIDMDIQTVPFSILNLSAPEQPGFQMVLAKIGIASRSLGFDVAEVPTIQSVSPLIVIPGKLTEFRTVATAPAGKQIIQYRWDFGDGSGEQMTAGPNITHTYSQIKTYILTVKAQDTSGLVGSRTFTITSNITRELLNTTIQNLRIRLDNFASQYNNIEYWYRDMIGVNVTIISTTLDVLESQLATATQTQLLDIKNELDALNVPISINDTLVLRDSPYIPNLNEIDPSYVSDMTGEDYDSNLKTEYQNAVALWQQDNVNLRLGGEAKALFYEDRIEDKITVVNIKVDPLVGISNAYVIFSLPYGVSYNDVRLLHDAYEVSDLNDAIGFVYTGLSGLETISITLPGKVDFSDINFYISPSLQEVQVGVQPLTEPPKKPPYLLAIFLIIVIAIVVLIILWFIWKGSGKREKKKLFKNPMDLYHITNFISNNQAAGVPKNKIIERLKKAGWSKKQIDHAFKQIGKQKPIFTPSVKRRPTRRI
ncbi:MAG: PKD domain-containing protein [Candidatus Pacearchaeota archaeon]|nr:MAG: PKD domain-containing protein [Candidatus Pacearchaeota archaeon]